MSRFESFLGFPNASDKALHLGKILFFLFPFANVTFTLSTTFYTIFVAEALGNGDFMEGLDRVSLPVFILFFALAGASLDLQALGETWPLAVCLALVRSAGIFGATWLAARLCRDPRRVR